MAEDVIAPEKKKRVRSTKIDLPVKPKSKNQYVPKEELFQAMMERKVLVDAALAAGLPKPQISDYIARSIMMIAERYSRGLKFGRYTYREEMVSDAIENCLKYLDNFSKEVSENPFAYFTTIIHWAFVRRINDEEKALYTKYKIMHNAIIHQEELEEALKLTQYGNDFQNAEMEEFIDAFEEKEARKKAAKRKKQEEAMAAKLKEWEEEENQQEEIEETK